VIVVVDVVSVFVTGTVDGILARVSDSLAKMNL